MAQPTSKEEFKDYVLRKLGAPVIEINVSEEQIDDRVDEAGEIIIITEVNLFI
jgi:hypothetical protein